MKKIVVIGGAGTVGNILTEGLRKNYNVIIMDYKIEHPDKNHIQVDATNYSSLLHAIPENTDVIINLLRVETTQPIEDVEMFDKMTAVFFKATYYLLLVAKQYQIKKVIFASSNHVTDYYEKDGNSLLGREITVNDYPYPRGLYGVLKIASEQAGFIFSLNSDVAVINIRIGSVPNEDESLAIQKNNRLRKTLLSKEDVTELFSCAIDADIKYGTYYGVSDNDGKPWDLYNAIDELGFKSKKNANDFME